MTSQPASLAGRRANHERPVLTLIAAALLAVAGLLGSAPRSAATPPSDAALQVPGDARTVTGRDLTGHTTWSGNLRVTGPVVIPPGATLTVEPGTQIFFDLPAVGEIAPDAAWITVLGGIVARGTVAAPILFTPVKPRRNPLENMVDVREAEAAIFRRCVFRNGPWGLHLHDSRVTIEQCVFRDNYGGVRGRGGAIVLRANHFEGNRIGIRLWRASPVIVENSFTENLTGIFFRQEIMGAVVQRNSFDDVEYGIKLGELQTSDVDAAQNWWGLDNPAGLEEKIFDGADAEGVGRVSVEPRLAQPWQPEGAVVPLAKPRPPGDGTVTAGKAYFEFQAPVLGGGTVTLSAMVGQNTVLLQFWSITCTPCLEELPLLARLQAEYGTRGLRVIGVNIDNGDPAKLRDGMEARGLVIPYPVALDPNGAVSASYVPWAVPVTVLIDRTGMVRAVHTGYKPAVGAVIEAEVGELLGTGNSADTATATAKESGIGNE